MHKTERLHAQSRATELELVGNCCDCVREHTRTSERLQSNDLAVLPTTGPFICISAGDLGIRIAAKPYCCHIGRSARPSQTMLLSRHPISVQITAGLDKSRSSRTPGYWINGCCTFTRRNSGTCVLPWSLDHFPDDAAWNNNLLHHRAQIGVSDWMRLICRASLALQRESVRRGLKASVETRSMQHRERSIG